MTYVISAANDADREDWIQTIEAAMSSSFEVGRLSISIIEVCFKHVDHSGVYFVYSLPIYFSAHFLLVLPQETLYCTLIFGRQRFQTIAVPPFPARWDQSTEL